MSEKQPLPPDLLHRFTPTPYVLKIQVEGQSIRIEADDLEIALAIRNFCQWQKAGEGVQIHFWRLVRDRHAGGYKSDLEVVSTGKLRTMMHKSGSIFISDALKGELFGFIAMGLTMYELTMRLLPLFLDVNEAKQRDSAFYKQVTNGTLCSDNSRGNDRYLRNAAEDYVKYTLPKM
jgi:hypothetical protein